MLKATFCRHVFVFIASLGSLGWRFEFAQASESRISGGRKTTHVVSLLEMNPADLLWDRYRLAYENLFMDGVSFAWTGELQGSRQTAGFSERSLSSGVALQVYPQSSVLDGFFLRGEADVAVSFLERKATQQQPVSEATTSTLRFAGDLGWRVRMGEKLTGSAAYGLRTTVPQPLWGSENESIRNWLEKRSQNPDVRVQINLGVLL